MRHAVCRGTISAMQTFARSARDRLVRRDAHRLARRPGIRANATGSARCSGTGVRVPARPERRRARRALRRAANTDQPRLRMVDPGRRQPQRERRRLISRARRDRVATGAAAAAPPRRAHLQRVAHRRRRAEHVRGQHSRSSRRTREYEARFVIVRPRRRARRRRSARSSVRTRAEPVRYAGGRVFHVYPHGFTGQKTEPSFEGLMCAYNEWCAGTDWATSGRPRVRPGDTILVHAGVYQYNRYEYTNDADRQPHDAARRHVLPDGRRHARACRSRSSPPATARSCSTATATTRCSTCAPRITPISKASRFATPRSRSSPARSSSRARRG